MISSYYDDKPLTRLMLEKRGALPPQEQTQAIVQQGEKKKKGLSTGAKLLGLGGALAVGLGTGKVQAAGKALKNVMKNPSTGKFDPIGAVKRGYRDMGNTTQSVKRQQTAQSNLKAMLGGSEGGVVREMGNVESGVGGFLRKRGLIGQNNRVVGNLGSTGQQNVIRALEKEMPELFENGVLRTDLVGKLSPEQILKAEQRALEIAKQQQLGGLTAGQQIGNKLRGALPGELAVIGGLTGIGVAGELSTKQDASGRQRSLGERLIRGATVGAAGVALNPLFLGSGVGFVPGMLAFEAGNRGAGFVGGLAGRATTKAQGGEFGSVVDEAKQHTPFMGGH